MELAEPLSVRVVYFAAARDLTRTSEENVLLDTNTTVRAFRVWLATHQPALAPYLSRMRIAINAEFASDDSPINTGDELTVLPPVAGGATQKARDATLAEVRSEPLSIDEVVRAVRRPSAGAISIFLGVVRDHHQGQAVQRLDYEAYVELANKEMARILDGLTRTHPNTSIAALHRVGELAIGDTAVVVAASAAHRDEAFALCRSAIDLIKETVPVWKKEWSPDGSALWVNLAGDERK